MRRMSFFRRFTPTVSLPTRLVVGGVIWAMAGGMLCIRAGIVLVDGGRGWMLIPAFVLGLIKGRVLARIAGKNIVRLFSQPDMRCVGSVYTWKSWAFVVLMAALGMLLRRLHIAPAIYGTLIFAVGVALLYGSWPCFVAFGKISRDGQERTEESKDD